MLSFFVVIFVGALALNGAPVLAQDDTEPNSPAVVGEVPAVPVSYCHMKFPAIEEGTLGTAHPRLEDPSEGDMIDYYGSCGHNPIGRSEVQQQILQEQWKIGSQFND
jgi:hypothetical protein